MDFENVLASIGLALLYFMSKYIFVKKLNNKVYIIIYITAYRIYKVVYRHDTT